jgi:hypothetical protein
MKYLADIIQIALQRRLASASLRIALVVGMVLNLINQGSTIWNEQAFSLGQFALNFVVPFCVSSYSAARNEMSLLRISQSTQNKPVSDNNESIGQT